MKMEDKKYNGWTNYETWLVNLWIDNDEAVQQNVKNLCSKKFDFECENAVGSVHQPVICRNLCIVQMIIEGIVVFLG